MAGRGANRPAARRRRGTGHGSARPGVEPCPGSGRSAGCRPVPHRPAPPRGLSPVGRGRSECRYSRRHSGPECAHPSRLGRPRRWRSPRAGLYPSPSMPGPSGVLRGPRAGGWHRIHRKSPVRTPRQTPAEWRCLRSRGALAAFPSARSPRRGSPDRRSDRASTGRDRAPARRPSGRAPMLRETGWPGRGWQCPKAGAWTPAADRVPALRAATPHRASDAHLVERTDQYRQPRPGSASSLRPGSYRAGRAPRPDRQARSRARQRSRPPAAPCGSEPEGIRRQAARRGRRSS